MPLRCLVLSCAALLAATVRPAHAQPFAADTPVVDLERYTSQVQVGSTGVSVGLMTGSAEPSADPVRLSVYLPPSGADSLCIHLVSRDGRYEGRFRFPRPRHAGRLTLRLPTRQADRLRAYGPERLAALAHVSPTCSLAKELYVLSEWGTTPSPHRLRLLLNPEPAHTVNIEVAGDSIPKPCARIDATGTTAFDHVCVVDVSPAISGEHQLRVLQRYFDRFLAPVPLRVWVPDAW